MLLCVCFYFVLFFYGKTWLSGFYVGLFEVKLAKEIASRRNKQKAKNNKQQIARARGMRAVNQAIFTVRAHSTCMLEDQTQRDPPPEQRTKQHTQHGRQCTTFASL